MRRRAVTLAAILAGALLPLPLAAQAPPRRPGPAAPPPSLPPPPPALDEPPVALAPGLAALPGGGWRLRFAGDAEAPTPEQAASLREIAARLAERSAGRVTLFSQASVGEDASSLRRLALERARAVKAALEAGGLDPRRVDIRPLGRTPAMADLVDIMPPGVATGVAPDVAPGVARP